MNFTIVVPLYNEAENVENLINEIYFVFKDYKPIEYEIILVNDASNDNTSEILNSLEKKYQNLKTINNKKNVGQSFSLIKGIKSSKFNTIVTLDGDCQNNPADIPKLLKKYNSDNDIGLVGGLRLKRKDKIIKKISSKIANKVRKIILNDKCDDTGCSLKVFDKKIFIKLPEFEGLHRFMPALFSGYGCKTFFIPVDHRARLFGKSNYGTFGRLYRGVIDIIRVLKILKNLNND
tara:strand:- start:992 stop:1693 length:702 start_codon:yes stop_codon:yes gene_type:complete